MAQACDPQSLVTAANCIEYCLPRGLQYPALIYLACQVAGQATDPASLQTLVNNAKCIEQNIPPGMWMPAMINLACIIAGGSGGGPQPPTPPVSCSDPDATNFLNTAGISDTKTVNAVCNLVIALKSSGVWTLMDAIYPMVGGTRASTSYNLRNPSANQMVWNGSPTFSSAGVTGDGVSAYGDPGILPASSNFSLNSATVGADLNSATTGYLLGCEDNNGSFISARVTTPSLVLGPLNSDNSQSLTPASVQGLSLVTRTDGNNMTGYGSDGSSTTFSSPIIDIPGPDIVFLAFNNKGSIVNTSTHTISFAVIGGGLNSVQAASLLSAVKTFQTALSRT